MRRVLEGMARAVGRAGDLGMAISAVAVVAMMLLITVEVVGRNVFKISTLIADEMAGYLLVVVTFLGLAATLRTGGFIRIDAYRTRIHGGARLALDLGIYGLAAAFTGVLDWYLWTFAVQSYRFGTTSIYFTRTPLWIPHALMAAGGSLLLLDLLAGASLVGSGARVEPPGDVRSRR